MIFETAVNNNFILLPLKKKGICTVSWINIIDVDWPSLYLLNQFTSQIPMQRENMICDTIRRFDGY